MKILFICGSMEAGRDGVGDYTRRLACELIRTGHEVGVIALNDTHIMEEYYGDQKSGDISVPVLRIPSGWVAFRRFERAGFWIDVFNPEWLSLQFVPFSFNPKGFAFSLIKPLKKLGRNKKWHILFHELWIGMHIGASGKESVWGYIQKKMILKLLSGLKPQLVQTQSRLYKAMLAKSGINAELLPLFSNIPVIHNKDDGHLQLIGTKQTILEKNIMLLFGELHDNNTPVTQFTSEVKAYSDKTGNPFALLIIGRSGNERLKWEDAWKKEGMEVILAGEQSAGEISSAMQLASFGLTTTVYNKVDKSGSVAAMAEHGLKIICVSGPWQPRKLKLLDRLNGILEYKEGNLEQLLTLKKEKSFFGNLTTVAQNLISSMEN